MFRLKKEPSKEEENEIVQRIITLENRLKESQFQRDRYERMFKISSNRFSKLEQMFNESTLENEKLRQSVLDFEMVQDLKVELFFSFAIAAKLSFHNSGFTCNNNIQDIYDTYVAEQWEVSEWPMKIMKMLKE